MELIQNLWTNRRKYAVVALAVFLALAWAYNRVSCEVHRNELIGESLLHLSPRAIQLRNSVSKPRLVNVDNETQIRTDRVSDNAPYIPPESSVTIKTKDPTKTLDQVITVSYHTMGFTLEPGLDLSVFPPGAGLDAKFFYWERLGAIAGLQYYISPVDKISPVVGASYRLRKHGAFSNTEWYVDYAPMSSFVGSTGFRINF